MFIKKIKTFSIDVIRILLRGASSTSHAVSDFEVVIFFETVSVGLKVLKCWRFGHARMLGHSTHEITLNDEYPSKFLPGRKFLWITLEQLFGIFIKLPIFDSSRAICVLLRGQNQLWSHLGEERPQKPQNFNRNPSYGRIDQKRGEKISDSYTKAFSWNTYSRSNLYSEKCHFTGKSIGDQPRFGFGFGLLCRHTASNSITPETHTSGAQ